MAKITITSVNLTLGDLKDFVNLCKNIPDSTPLKIQTGLYPVDIVHIEGDINEIIFFDNII